MNIAGRCCHRHKFSAVSLPCSIGKNPPRLRPYSERTEGIMKRQPLIVCAALLLLTAVAAGAFGAHGLKRVVTPDLLATWSTGVLYQLVHGLGILVTQQLQGFLNRKLLQLAGYAMLAGTLIFSGSIYLIVLTGFTRLGAITPIGGLLFLIAWTMVAITAWSGTNSKQNTH